MIRIAKKAVARLHRVARYARDIVCKMRCRLAILHCATVANRSRGTSLVRYYWHCFLDRKKDVIRGIGLEIDMIGTLQSYGAKRMTRAVCMNIAPGDGIDIVADLCDAWNIKSDQFDVFINQFAFHVIRDDRKALFHSLRILKPGGTLLCNFVCTCFYHHQGFACGTERYEMMRWYTPAGVRSIIAEFLPDSHVEIEIFGNRMMHVAYVLALDVENFAKADADQKDNGWPIIICAALTKPTGWDEDEFARRLFNLPK